MAFEFSACADVIGYISSIVTIEEAGRAWIKEMKGLFSEKEFDFQEYISENEVVNRKLDQLKQWLVNSGRKDIFHEDEIRQIEGEVFDSVPLDYYDKKELYEILDRLFAGINKYISEHLSIGEKIIIERQEKVLDRICALEDRVRNHTDYRGAETSRFITEIAPNPPSKFGYREKEIKEITELLKNKNNIAICGVGGIGKTSILRYMYQYHMEHTKYYLGWIPYGRDLKKDVMDHCLLIKNISDADERENALKTFLRENNKTVVWFIDNVTGDIQEDSFFQFLTATTKVYISTRYWPEDECFIKYEIESVQPDDALKLFWDYYGEEVTSSDIRGKVVSLIQGINYHTLMIEMAAKAARFAEEPLAEFIDQVNEIGYGYSQEEIKTGHDKKEETIAGHLSKLYKLETSSEEKNYILYNFAIMQDSVLPFDFRKWISDKNRAAGSKADFRWLTERGWIKKETNGYSMHWVIRESILAQGRVNVHDIVPLLQRIQKDEYFDEMLDFTEINQRINIAKSVLEYFEPYEGDDEPVMEIMEGFILACGNQSRFEEGIRFAKRQYDWSLTKYKTIYNDDTAEALYNLARILCAARRFDEARECCEALYAICNRLYDKNDMRLFYFREIFIEICIEQKDYDLATAEYVYADAMENPRITERKKMKINMAFCGMLINKYADAAGSGAMSVKQADALYLDEAEAVLMKMYPMLMCEYGENHLEMLIWYQNMANIYCYRQNYYEAAKYDRKIVGVREEKLGEMNGKLAEAYFNLSDDLYRIAVHEKKSAGEALDYVNKAYEIAAKVYAGSKLETDVKILMKMIERYQKEHHFGESGKAPMQ